MKNLLFTSLLATSLFVTTSCELLKGLAEEEKTEQQLAGEALVGTWSATDVKVNGSAINDVFTNLQVTFAANEDLITGSISVNGDLIPNTSAKLIGTNSNSTWRFSGTSLAELVLSSIDGNSSGFVANVNTTGTSLVLNFVYQAPNARENGLVGNYQITLSK